MSENPFCPTVDIQGCHKLLGLWMSRRNTPRNVDDDVGLFLFCVKHYSLSDIIYIQQASVPVINSWNLSFCLNLKYLFIERLHLSLWLMALDCLETWVATVAPQGTLLWMSFFLDSARGCTGPWGPYLSDAWDICSSKCFTMWVFCSEVCMEVWTTEGHVWVSWPFLLQWHQTFKPLQCSQDGSKKLNESVGATMMNFFWPRGW